MLCVQEIRAQKKKKYGQCPLSRNNVRSYKHMIIIILRKPVLMTTSQPVVLVADASSSCSVL